MARRTTHRTNWSLTPEIEDAVRRGEVDTLALQLKGTPKLVLARTDKRETLLHLAAEAGHLDVVRLLLAANAEVDAVTPSEEFLVEFTGLVAIGGTTPLLVALRNRHVEVATELLEAGANPHVIDANGRSIFHTAIAQGFLAIAEKLLGLGVSVNELGAD